MENYGTMNENDGKMLANDGNMMNNDETSRHMMKHYGKNNDDHKPIAIISHLTTLWLKMM